MKVTIEDTFMDNTQEPIYRVRRDGMMVACIHYRTKFWGAKPRISRTQARDIARAIKKAVSK